ncbi:MAG: acyloxyacyl hydrolase [Alphaproteobacteria bacterium]
MRCLFSFLGLLTLCLAAAPARADDPDFLDLQLGTFDVRHAHTFVADLEYRSDYKLWVFKPIGGLLVTGRGATYLYSGFAVDIFFGNRIVVTPSEAVGVYNRGNDVNLGAVPEFRSSVAVAYRFDDRSRLGVMFHHISNAGLGRQNPGSETTLMTYSLPLDRLRSLFGKLCCGFDAWFPIIVSKPQHICMISSPAPGRLRRRAASGGSPGSRRRPRRSPRIPSRHARSRG